MKLSEAPSKRTANIVDRLPEDVRSQLIDAYRHDSHSVATMVAWAVAEGYPAVTRNALVNWFDRLPYTRGDAVTDG